MPEKSLEDLIISFIIDYSPSLSKPTERAEFATRLRQMLETYGKATLIHGDLPDTEHEHQERTPMPAARSNTLDMVVIYDKPIDFPDEYVARMFHITAAGAAPSDLLAHSADLSTIRMVARGPGRIRLHRTAEDELQILEVWI